MVLGVGRRHWACQNHTPEGLKSNGEQGRVWSRDPIGLEELIISMSGLHCEIYTKLGSPDRETDQR